MHYPYFDLIDENCYPANEAESYGSLDCLNVGVYLKPDPSGNTAHPDVTFAFGGIRGELHFLTANFTAICLEHTEVATQLFALSQTFAVQDKPLRSFLGELENLGIPRWSPTPDSGEGGTSLSA